MAREIIKVSDNVWKSSIGTFDIRFINESNTTGRYEIFAAALGSRYYLNVPLVHHTKFYAWDAAKIQSYLTKFSFSFNEDCESILQWKNYKIIVPGRVSNRTNTAVIWTLKINSQIQNVVLNKAADRFSLISDSRVSELQLGGYKNTCLKIMEG